jgi:type IV pilus assembly protein PilM
MPDDELATAVNWEAQNKFPFDTATATIQHLRAGEVRVGDESLEEVIIFAVPRVEVDAQIRLAEEMGLEPVSLDAECCAVFRGFERFLRRREDETQVCAFADIGAETTVVIAEGRDIVFVKSIPIGGELFNRSVAECLDLSPVEAEALCRQTAGQRRDPEREGAEAEQVNRAVLDAIRPHIEDLASEIALCLRYFTVTFRRSGPERLVLTGGGSHDPAVTEALSARLSVPAEVGDPFRGMRTNEIEPVLDRRGCRSEWATAVGLSLKGFSLASSRRPSWAA